MNLSRRSFVASAAATTALGAATVAAPVMADEAATVAGPEWLGSAPGLTDADCTEVVDVDVLVVGCGCAGLPCAATAAEEGLKVLAIDRMEMGFGVRCSAVGAIDSSIQKELGVTIDKTEIINDIVNYADGKCDMRLWKQWADESGEAVSWYIDHVNASGAAYVENEWSMPEGTRYHMWPTGHATIGSEMKWAGEHVTTEHLINMINSTEGCEHRGFTKLEQLIVEDGAVVGAYISGGEDFDVFTRVNAAKGVVIATGGYLLNADMLNALQPDTVIGLSGFFTSSQVYGEGIKAAMWAGAKLEDTHMSLVFDRGIRTPEQETGTPFVDGVLDGYNVSSQPWLKVNIDGQRFCNESSPYDYVFHAASKFRNHAWYCVMDANWIADMERFHTIGCSTQQIREGGDHLMGATDEEIAAGMERRIESGQVVQADTIEELATKLGIDVDNFVKTVERHNELFDMQEDVDFGKEAFRLSEMRTAPFYGMKMGGIALATFSGIEITTESEALDADGNVINGLYMIGNDSGNWYNVSYPNFAAGLNAGRCVTQGRHVAKAIAAK